MDGRIFSDFSMRKRKSAHMNTEENELVIEIRNTLEYRFLYQKKCTKNEKQMKTRRKNTKRKKKS